jgi:hypothetical protein
MGTRRFREGESFSVMKSNSFILTGLFKIIYFCQVPVAHTYYPNYSRGREQEDRCSKPAWANSSQDPILKKAFTKKG